MLPCKWLFVCNGVRSYFSMASRLGYFQPADPEFLQPVPCAHADDFAVAALSFRFRSLMPALFPAFMAVDSIAGLNLNHRKSCLSPTWHRQVRRITGSRLHELW